ncbi:MAG: hypothetical protein E4H01_09265 [Lysobacterales bacterium]|nr:MAG: hypothetical protein E4H01_09265 [Xanthomonadales bacterium]
MKRLMIFLALIGLSGVAMSAPFVVADVVTTVTSCNVIQDGAPAVSVPSEADATSATGRACKLDLAGISSGQHTVTMTAVDANDPLFVRESAASAPLAFGVPGIPAVPGTLRLKP